MKSKKWIKISISTAFLGFALLMLINYIVDPFNIFHSKILKHDFQVNERFVKIEYLEKNHDKFNGYMIGSSRIGTTDPKVIEQYIPNSKVYNMTMSGATLYDYLMHIRYMIKEQYPIKTIYLQLDPISMNFYGNLESDYLNKLHPYVENKSLALFYFEYLSLFFPFNIKNKITQNIHYTFKTTYDLETGVWKNLSNEKKISENCEEYVKHESSFHRDDRAILKYTKKEETRRDLKEIVALCKINHIKLYIFMTPHNKSIMDTLITEDYLDYLKDIASISEFYDFSGYNSITTNNCNYYERSHYRPFIGSLIAAKIFDNKSIQVPNDFGKLVNKKNITEHLKNRKENIINYRKRNQQ